MSIVLFHQNNIVTKDPSKNSWVLFCVLCLEITTNIKFSIHHSIACLTRNLQYCCGDFWIFYKITILEYHILEWVIYFNCCVFFQGPFLIQIICHKLILSVRQYLLSTFYEQTSDSVCMCIKLNEPSSFKGVISKDLKPHLHGVWHID